MRIDFKWTPLALLAVLVAGCSALSAPGDRAIPPGDGESTGEDDDPPDRTPWVPPPFPDPSCVAGGQTFSAGTSVPSGDSCSRCVCSFGSVVCTAVQDPACTGPDAGPGTDAGPGGGAGTGPDAGPGPDVGSCDVAGQRFLDGSDVPSGDDCNTCGCNDGSVTCTATICDAVFCALFVEESDGVCSRFPLDPCVSQDPDCISEPGATEP